MIIRSYSDLKKRVDDLAATLLPIISIAGNYSLREMDLVRSYVLLAHAEFESFCEELVLQKVKEAERRSHSTRCSLMISRLILYRAASTNKELEALSDASISDACAYFRSEVERNHGIKRQNILRLFVPIGLNHHDFDELFLATLDAFGAQRGSVAHRSYKTQQPLDPVSEKARVDLILPEIARIYQLTRMLT